MVHVDHGLQAPDQLVEGLLVFLEYLDDEVQDVYLLCVRHGAVDGVHR